MAEKTIILEGRHLTKIYRQKGKQVHALKDVSFCLFKGEVLGIAGESGCGKSTLLKLLACLEQPDTGELLYRGAPYLKKTPAYAGTFLHMIFQDAVRSFDPSACLRQSVTESMRPSKESSNRSLTQILNAVALEQDLLIKKPGALSGGQCQRMSIARALLSGAEILLCDEITSALDVTTQDRVIKLLHILRSKHALSIIFVSHDPAVLHMLCDRILVMKDGSIVEEGDARTVLGSPKHPYTRQLIESVFTLKTDVKEEPCPTI